MHACAYATPAKPDGAHKWHMHGTHGISHGISVPIGAVPTPHQHRTRHLSCVGHTASMQCACSMWHSCCTFNVIQCACPWNAHGGTAQQALRSRLAPQPRAPTRPTLVSHRSYTHCVWVYCKCIHSITHIHLAQPFPQPQTPWSNWT